MFYINDYTISLCLLNRSWFSQLQLICLSSSGDQNIKQREAKRKSMRFQPTAAAPRTASRITIGASQVFQEHTRADRFGLGIIQAHQTKFFYAAVMDGYNGWHMGKGDIHNQTVVCVCLTNGWPCLRVSAEYIRKRLPGCLEASMQSRPAFLIRNSITAAFMQIVSEEGNAWRKLVFLKPCRMLSFRRTNWRKR